jgi:deoxyribodipyrimidine photolyase-like uncharacterized protein
VNRRRDAVDGKDPDFFDEDAEEFFRLFGAFAGDDVVELVGEAGEGANVGRLVGLRGEPAAEVGLLVAERFQAGTVALDAFVAVRREALRDFYSRGRRVGGVMGTGQSPSANPNPGTEPSRARAARPAATSPMCPAVTTRSAVTSLPGDPLFGRGADRGRDNAVVGS